jgi:hypothetical protein
MQGGAAMSAPRVPLTMAEIRALLSAANAALAGDGEGDMEGVDMAALQRAADKLTEAR